MKIFNLDSCPSDKQSCFVLHASHTFIGWSASDKFICFHHKMWQNRLKKQRKLWSTQWKSSTSTVTSNHALSCMHHTCSLAEVPVTNSFIFTMKCDKIAWKNKELQSTCWKSSTSTVTSNHALSCTHHTHSLAEVPMTNSFIFIVKCDKIVQKMKKSQSTQWKSSTSTWCPRNKQSPFVLHASHMFIGWSASDMHVAFRGRHQSWSDMLCIWWLDLWAMTNK